MRAAYLRQFRYNQGNPVFVSGLGLWSRANQWNTAHAVRYPPRCKYHLTPRASHIRAPSRSLIGFDMLCRDSNSFATGATNNDGQTAPLLLNASLICHRLRVGISLEGPRELDMVC